MIAESTSQYYAAFCTPARQPDCTPKLKEPSSSRTMLPIILILLAVAPGSLAQSTEPSSPQVEVASIKPSRPDATVRNAAVAFPPGRFEATNTTLSEILNALRGYDGRVKGGPKWAQTDRYDIVAKFDRNVAPGQQQALVLALLKDRFRLEIHLEEITEPVLALTVRKKLFGVSPAKDEESTKVLDGIHKVEFQAVAISRLVNYLHQMLKTTILDRTGLTGKYDFTLDIDRAAEELASATGSHFADRVRAAAEALGFAFVPDKANLSATVIDSAERPTDN
jgi:uncharacterized protein (TIGR03435 family)